MLICSQENCSRIVLARGLCDLHYRRAGRRDELDSHPRVAVTAGLRRYRQKPTDTDLPAVPVDGEATPVRVCVAEGCERVALKRGLCGRHYQAAKAAGTLAEYPSMPRRIWKEVKFDANRPIGSCIAFGCINRPDSKRLCKTHYKLARERGLIPPARARRTAEMICSHEGCDEVAAIGASGLCSKHHRAFRRYDNPDFQAEQFKKYRQPLRLKSGYVEVWGGDHPNAKRSGRILEHRLVMSDMIGRPLTREEDVHHRNAVRHDNRPENLELWSGKHAKGARVVDLVAYAREILALYPETLLDLLPPPPKKARGKKPG